MLEQIIEAHQLANKLMDEHGLIDDGWRFKISNTKTFVGRCYHYKKEIEFSKWYLMSPTSEVKDTILHEIAHALVGPDHGHDHVWRRMALKVGCRPETCADDTAKFNGKFNYRLECPNHSVCGAGPWHRHRMTQRMRYAMCPNCESHLLILDLKTGDIFKSVGGRQ